MRLCQTSTGNRNCSVCPGEESMSWGRWRAQDIVYITHTIPWVQGGSAVKNLLANAGDTKVVSSIPGSGRSRGGENGNPLQYSCLENSMDWGAWQATVHGGAKSQTWLSMHVCIHHLPHCPISVYMHGGCRTVNLYPCETTLSTTVQGLFIVGFLFT